MQDHRPPLLLIHGAANAAWVWDAWRAHLTPLGWQANVLDLRGHGRSLPVDFAEVIMEHYLQDVESVTSQMVAAGLPHPVLVGWSMGGLLAMMYARAHPETPAIVLIAPSPPLEVQGRTSARELMKTPLSPYGPELYGLRPDDFAASRETLFDLTEAEARRVLENSRGALESGLARRQRKDGISIPRGSIGCPGLVVIAEKDTFQSVETTRRVALHLAADTLSVPNVSHWGIVCHDAAVAIAAPDVASWLAWATTPLPA
jgi:pimeloyl-ACP methyl ester carboxylesterase